MWLNQYANPNELDGALPHDRTGDRPVSSRDLDVLFVGAGTTGTLMGCARYFREWHPPVRVVAVDPVGSVTFGSAARSPDDPRPRHERPPAAARRVLHR